MAFLQRPTVSSMTDHSSQSPRVPTSPPQGQQSPPAPSWTSKRSLKQATLFLAGATFLTASTFLTRRIITRRHLAILPKRFTPSNQPSTAPISGPFEALEALNLATLNVAAVGMMMVGGLGWAFDISTLEDLRRKVRGGMGIDGTGRNEKDVEEEFEEWIATVLERKAEKEKVKKVEGQPLSEKWVNERGKER